MASAGLVMAADTGLKDPFGAPQYTWAQLPDNAPWGSTAAVERGPRGEIWGIDRCNANLCDGSDIAPIVQLDTKTGKPIKRIGAGLFIFPHGLVVDRSGNLWVTDSGVSKDKTKGVQVIELSPEGKVLMRIGTAGVQGDDATHFASPTDVAIAPNGDIFVADGHTPIPPSVMPSKVARIMKFSKDGKFIKQWGSPGKGPGQFNNPHALAFDTQGRLFLADRGNDRFEIFDQNGKLLDEWKQFGRPAGLYIDKQDRLYAIDADSTEQSHPGFAKGIWIGSIKTALPDSFIPDEHAGEGVVVAPDGNMYAGVNVAPHGITKYAKK